MHRTMDFPKEVAKLRAIYADFQKKDSTGIERNRLETFSRINDVVKLIRKNKSDKDE